MPDDETNREHESESSDKKTWEASVKDAVLANDEPVAKKHPKNTFAFLMLAYPVGLILLILAAFLVFAFWNNG